VAGLDRFAPPHDRGSSHGDSRIIRSAYFEDPAYLPLLRHAFPLWRQLEAESGEALLTMSGAAMIGAAGSEVVSGALRTAREHGLDCDLLEGDAAAARLPQHRLDPGDVVLWDTVAGVLRPERCIAAMLGRARSLGADIHADTAVERITPDSANGVRIDLAGGGSLQAAHAVVCAGAWTRSLLPSLAVPLRIERQVMAWFAVDDAARFRPDRFPAFIRELPGDRAFYGVPTLDGATVKLAMHHRGRTAAHPDDLDRSVGEEDLAPLRQYAQEHLRGVHAQPVRATTCMYTNTPDEHFVVDALPDAAAVTVASACSGHGFKFAPVIGEIAAGLALESSTPHDIARFRLQRFAG
jgi:sarcosine oxidase